MELGVWKGGKNLGRMGKGNYDQMPKQSNMIQKVYKNTVEDVFFVFPKYSWRRLVLNCGYYAQ